MGIQRAVAALINSVLKDWACECIFFFNYNRINICLSNEAVKTHMAALFGEERAAKLRDRLEPLKPWQRELTVLEKICEALVEMGGKFVLPFCFKNEKGTRTSHHLIFVSKHPLGYKIMKRVMANESSDTEQGVPTFEYNPATSDQPLLFELARPLDDLEEMLLSEYAGRTMTMAEIYDAHNYGRRYIDKNYKDILSKILRSAHLTRVFSEFPSSHQNKTVWMGCGNGRTSAGTRSGGLSIPATRGCRT